MATNKDNVETKEVENPDDAEKKDDDIDPAQVAECKTLLTKCALQGTNEKYAKFRESAVSLMFLIGKFKRIPYYGRYLIYKTVCQTNSFH